MDHSIYGGVLRRAATARRPSPPQRQPVPDNNIHNDSSTLTRVGKTVYLFHQTCQHRYGSTVQLLRKRIGNPELT
jgi:hypothetical protein